MDLSYFFVALGSASASALCAMYASRSGMVAKDTCKAITTGISAEIAAVHKYVSDTHVKVDETALNVAKILGKLEVLTSGQRSSSSGKKGGLE